MVNAKRFNYIDGLRGVAIAIVIITHSASIAGETGITLSLAEIGGMGVQLFFVISAFTIFYTLNKSDSSPTQFRDFFIKRLFRIIPIYWLGIILYTAVYGLGSRGWKLGPELWHYPVHIFLLNVLHPSTLSSVVPGGWSISCEVLFYMMVPTLYVYLISKKRLFVLFVLTLGVLPILNHYLQSYSLATVFKDIDEYDVRKFFYRWIPNQLGSFSFGILLYFIFKDGRYTRYISGKKLNLALIVVCSILIVVLRNAPQRQFIYSFLFMVTALVLSVYPWRLYVNNFTVFLGRISFSGYLLHFLVLKQLTLFISKFFPSIVSNVHGYFAVVTVGAFVLTIPLAYFSYRFIEQNAVLLGKLFIKKLDDKRLQPA